jgi:DNA-binding transcriptional MerR regulator
MAGDGIYTAETLAFRAGVPLRTVRFYVQEKLIDPPLGRGRGANFTERHLAQLQQARTLQNLGFSLDDIRDRQSELILGPQTVSIFDSNLSFNAMRKRWHQLEQANRTPEAELNVEECIRIPMADGIELMVSQDRQLPSPRQLAEIALYLRKVFDRP